VKNIWYAIQFEFVIMLLLMIKIVEFWCEPMILVVNCDVMCCVALMSYMLNCLIFELFDLDLGKNLNLCFEWLVLVLNSLKSFWIKNTKKKISNIKLNFPKLLFLMYLWKK